LSGFVHRGLADHSDPALGCADHSDGCAGDALIICTLRSDKADGSRVFDQRISVKRGIDQRIPLPWVCAVLATILPLRRYRPHSCGKGLT